MNHTCSHPNPSVGTGRKSGRGTHRGCRGKGGRGRVALEARLAAGVPAAGTTEDGDGKNETLTSEANTATSLTTEEDSSTNPTDKSDTVTNTQPPVVTESHESDQNVEAPSPNDDVLHRDERLLTRSTETRGSGGLGRGVSQRTYGIVKKEQQQQPASSTSTSLSNSHSEGEGAGDDDHAQNSMLKKSYRALPASGRGCNTIRCISKGGENLI